MKPALSIVPTPQPEPRKVIDLAEWKASHMTETQIMDDLYRLVERAEQAELEFHRIRRRKFRIVS